MKTKINQLSILVWMDIKLQKRGSFEDFVYYLASGCSKMKIKIGFVFVGEPSNVMKLRFKEFHVISFSLQEKEINSIRAMIRILKETRPTLVHFNFLSLCSLLVPVCLLMGVKKVIHTDHISRQTSFDKSEGRLLKSIKRLRRQFWGKMVTHFIGVSGYVVNTLKADNNIPEQKISVVYNGVDLKRFSPSKDKYKLKQDILQRNNQKYIVSFVGQIIIEKGIFVFLESARLILKKKKDVLFIIVGDGPEKHNLNEMVMNWGISSNVIYLGIRDDVEDILRMSDILVLPSLWDEAFGLVIAEALSTEVVVVASKVGGIPEIIEDHKTGILIPPGNSAELANVTINLLENDEMRKNFGQAGRQSILQQFSIDRMVSETIEIYQKVL